MVSYIRDQLIKVFSPNQADVLAHVVVEAHDALATKSDVQELRDVVKDLAVAQQATERTLAELAEAQRATERQMAESAAHVDQRFAEMAEAQRATEQQVAELTASMRESFIRHDRADGWLYEMLLAKRLPAYIDREIRRCRVIEVQDLIESLEPLLDDGVLTVADLDDLRRVDLVATGFTDGEAVYLVGELSCTGDNEDAERAARRAAIVEKAGKRAIAFLACHQIGPAAAEFARRRGVRILERGNLLPAAG
jgi:hypothetical protein